MNRTTTAGLRPHGVRRQVPLDSTVPRLIARVALDRPAAIALRFGAETVTYRDLCLRAGRLAERLLRLGVRRGDVVGVLTHRSAGQVVALLAVLQAGAAYLPLDPATPEDRQAMIVEQAGALVVLAAADRVSGDRLDLDALLADTAAGPECDESVWRYSPGVGEDLAYIMYTSGSTGRPKGVMAPHRAIIHLVVGTDYVDLGPDDVVAFGSNIAFDAVTFEIWGPLLNGGTVCGLDQDMLLSTFSLGGFLAEHGVTTMFMTTALFHLHARLAPNGFAALRQLLVGGERLNPDAARRVLGARPPRRLLNVYGPTEATTFSTTLRLLHVPDDVTALPIGRPIANASAHVLDDDLRPVPPGEPGELYVGGRGVALGYRGQPELTAGRFVPDPEGGGRLYRTGDWASWNDRHLLEFHGRRDGQVKIRGFRIEVSEVESALAALPTVREAVVVPHGTGEARGLVAFVVPEEPGADIGDPAGELARSLPRQMVPAAVHRIGAIPLNANGKIDRAALTARLAGGSR